MHEIGERLFGDMLKLAAAAFSEVAAGRRSTVRPGDKYPVVADTVAGDRAGHMATIGGHAITARGNALDQRCFSHFIP